MSRGSLMSPSKMGPVTLASTLDGKLSGPPTPRAGAYLHPTETPTASRAGSPHGLLPQTHHIDQPVSSDRVGHIMELLHVLDSLAFIDEHGNKVYPHYVKGQVEELIALLRSIMRQQRPRETSESDSASIASTTSSKLEDLRFEIDLNDRQKPFIRRGPGAGFGHKKKTKKATKTKTNQSSVSASADTGMADLAESMYRKRIHELELTVRLLSANLSGKLLHTKATDQQRETERAEYLALLNRLSDMVEVQNATKLKLEHMQLNYNKLLSEMEKQRTLSSSEQSLSIVNQNILSERLMYQDQNAQVQLNDLSSKHRLTQEEVERLQRECVRLTDELERMRKERDEFQRLMEQYKAQAEANQAGVDQAGRIAALKKKFQKKLREKEAVEEQLRRENEVLRKRLAAATAPGLKTIAQDSGAKGAVRGRVSFPSFVTKFMVMHYMGESRRHLQDKMKQARQLAELEHTLSVIKQTHEEALAASRRQYAQDIQRLTVSMEKEKAEHERREAELERHIRELERVLKETESERQQLQMHIRSRDRRIVELEQQLAGMGSEAPETKSEHVEDVFIQYGRFMKKSFVGDCAGVRHNQKVLREMNKNGCSRILFSDEVEQQAWFLGIRSHKVLVITDQAVYLFSSAFAVETMLQIADISSVSVTKTSSEVVAIQHASRKQNDICVMAKKRPEIVYHLIMMFRSIAKSELPVNFGDRIFVGDKKNMQREVTVTRSEAVEVSSGQLLAPMRPRT